MLLMIDNYDSFTYNLVQYLGELGADVLVQRNDAITLDQVEAWAPERIVISPGPCTPAEAGISVPLLRRFAGRIPMLGVCLGHQAIGEAFGGRVVRAARVMHGKLDQVTHDGRGVFTGIPSPVTVTRYHSLAIERATLPDCLEVTATTPDAEIMGVRHREHAVEGVQFHPEAILTEHGHAMLRNFLDGRRSMSEAVQRTVEHREIFHDEMLALMRRIMSGEATPVMIAALMVGLRVKKETVGEIAAAAQVMREFATRVPVAEPESLLDIVGTGGDASHTFNISTASMFVAAGAGARVAKHGNRSVSSKSGSADVLEALGANIMLTPDQVATCIAETGVGFMFAPQHHGAMKHAAPVRKELGIRTIFNILGPLTNPAGAANQLLGVFHPDLVGILVRVLENLGSRHVLVVHGKDGMDEVSLGAATMVGELKDGEVREYEIHPEDFGMRMMSNRSLKVEDAQASKAMVLDALANAEGAARDIVVLNAGTALYAANRASSIKDGIEQARASIASGAAQRKLDEFVALTRKLGTGA